MLVSLKDLNFDFGARNIVRDANWTIFPKERIGLIGPNGRGKSTLLKLITNEYSPTAGAVLKSKDVSIGYFHQDIQSQDTEQSILNVAMEAFENAKSIERELEQIQLKLTENETDELLNLYSEKLHDFEIAGGYEMEHKTAEVLEGLGFVTADLNRKFKEFSGGWRMRVILGKMILQQPDLLLLDEPTNHLDLPSIQWIESFLIGYPGAIVVVSHDRYFLDRIITKTVELDNQKLSIYGGNYSFYEEEKTVRKEFQQREYENQQDFIRQQERFIERFKAKASKATQAQSVMKRLDALDRVQAPDNTIQQIKINFKVDTVPGRILATLENVSKSYGDISILKNASVELNRGDKIGLIGANGKGKSTLLRIITENEPVEGKVIPGHNVNYAFYAQHQLESLQLTNTILEELQLAGSGMNDLELRSMLGCFLFQGDDVFKKINILSGGEKARVALAKTIISKANFLLLDEPTNHLDLNSVNMLSESLNKYEGTYIIVSHDRYFIQKTATKIWEIVDGQIKVFDGGYDEWEEWKNEQDKITKSNKTQPKEKAEPTVTPTTIETKQATDNTQQSINNKQLKQLKNKFSKLEEDINKLQISKADLTNKLAQPEIYANKNLFLETETQYNKVEFDLKNLQTQYEEIFEQIMNLEA